MVRYIHCRYNIRVYDLCLHCGNDNTSREGRMAVVPLPSQTMFLIVRDVLGWLQPYSWVIHIIYEKQIAISLNIYFHFYYFMSQCHKYNPLFIAFIVMTMIFEAQIVVGKISMVYIVVYNSIAHIVVGIICIYGIVDSVMSRPMIFHIDNNTYTSLLQYRPTHIPTSQV